MRRRHVLRAWCALTATMLLGSCTGERPATRGAARPPKAPSAERAARAAELLRGPEWYRHAVFYEVNVRSFADSDGDGKGDLAGLTAKLDYLQGLGVDALWLMPVFRSPFHDSGYDVEDYRTLDPAYGDLGAFERLLTAAHERHIRVFLDLVLNHTASTHAWFQASRASRTGPQADYYVWSDTPSRPDVGCGTYGPQFGTSAWTFDEARGQYYFHRFYPQQPDLNFRNAAVVEETLDVARYWLDRGVDGFRCDVIGLLYETATSCDLVPETAAYIRRLRELVEGYPGRALVAESAVGSTPAPYFGSGRDMFHMTFNFPYGYFWSFAFLGGGNRRAAFDALRAVEAYPPGSQDASLIGSHDVARAWSRASQETWRYRRAVEVSMFTRATPFIYYGEELALRPGTEVVVDGRDAARTPMLWSGAPGYGFTTGRPWLAFGPEAESTNVAAEDAADDSMLSFYRRLLAFRRGHAVWGSGAMELHAVDNPALLVFTRQNDEEAYLVVVSFSPEAQETDVTLGDAAPGERVWGDAVAVPSAGHATLRVPAGGSGVFRLTR